jgi:hypothetical protein
MIFYCFIFSFSYAAIESIYRYYTNGNITTLAQTGITFLWTPIILYHFEFIENNTVKILLFPINIWTCEIIFGNLLLYFFNYRAWFYNDKLALLNGIISLSFTHYWIVLGILINFFLLITQNNLK